MTRKIFKLSDHVAHPGTLLRKQYLPAIGIENQQATRLGQLLQMRRSEVNRVLSAKAPVTPEMAQELGRVFNTSDTFWLLLQRIYDETCNTYASSGKKGTDRESLQGEEHQRSGLKPPVRTRRV